MYILEKTSLKFVEQIQKKQIIYKLYNIYKL